MKRTMIPIYPKSNRKDKEVVDGYYIVAMPSYAYLLDNLKVFIQRVPLCLDA